MNIKLTESQLINIIENVDKLTGAEKFAKTVDQFASLYKGELPDDVIDKMIDDVDGAHFTEEEFQVPLKQYKLTSPYGPRNIGGNASRNHMGVDLGVPSGTPIYCPADGEVLKSKNAGGKCGGFLKIRHFNGYVTKYCHLTNFNIVKKGQKVIKGQLVGKTGGGKNDPYRGNSMGPHLHYEVLRGNDHVDPQRVHTTLS